MVDLGAVSGGSRRRGLAGRVPGADVVRDPAAFFAITYPTTEIVETLRTLSQRWTAPESVPGTILLSGRYGQGKSHVLLAAHHALHAPDVARAWARSWGLPPLDLPPNPVVVTRSFIQHADEPLWDMLLDALSDGRKPKVGDYPDGERIESLLGERPVFLVMDELERWYDAQDDRTRSRNRNFLQALTEVSMRTSRLTVLTSVLGEKEEPGETIRRIRPLELSFRSAEDRQRVALFRLFTNRDGEVAQRAAAETTDAYLTSYARAQLRGLDGLRARMLAAWPFTPEFLDILTKKIPNLGGFQNTRGTLRFLAHVVRHTHARRALVSSQDLPFRDESVALALANLDGTGGEVVRRALGDNYDAVPESLPHRDELFSALVFYSIADPSHPGATLDELLLATLDPEENPLRIRDALAQLKQSAFNLHERDERFVFLAVENPHARINAMAGSQLVTRDAARERVLDAVTHAWGEAGRTALYLAEQWTELQRRLRELRAQRPRIVLSTVALDPATRLRIQNVDEDRNLVLLVEPRVRMAIDGIAYSVLADDELLRHARRIEACKLLLEGRPAEESAAVYRRVRDDETTRLRKAVGERFGQAIAWRRAGSTGAAVGDDWYDVCPLDTPTGDGLLAMWRQDLTGLPDIASEIRTRWADFRHRTVAELSAWFDRTPGLPVPLEAAWVSDAVRSLVKEGVFSLVAADGTPVARARSASLAEAELRGCTLADPRPDETGHERGKRPPIVHPRVTAQFDAARRGVHLSWTYPPLPPEGGTFATLIQRYSSARSWEVGQSYNLDTGETHEANRYLGTDESFADTERLQPGEWYHYYVFLVHHGPEGTTFTLSQRRDVGVPRNDPKPSSEVIESGIQPDLNRLIIELEKLVMSGRLMTTESRVRKIEVRVGAVTDGRVRSELSGKLAEKAGTALEASADLNFVVRGEYGRQDVLTLLRTLPRFEGANYAATLHLKADSSQRS